MELNKYKKTELINNISYYFLVNENREIENIYNLKKQELIKIIIDNNIKLLSEEELFNETKKIEKHNNLKQKILFNYLLEDKEIYIKNLDNLTIEELENLIKENNLNREIKENQYIDLNHILLLIIDYNKKYNNNIKIDKIKVKNIINLLLL